MKFYHTADIHLGAVPDRKESWSRQREKEIWENFYRLLDRAKSENVDLVLICGDLFHRQPLRRELNDLNYHFSKIEPVRVVMIAGNHDYISENSLYRDYSWSSNVRFLASSTCEYVYLEDLNTCIYGCSYHMREKTEPIYDSLRPEKVNARFDSLPKDCCHILMAHGGDDKHIPIDEKKLAQNGFDYVALGHIHKPRLSFEQNLAYAGALEPIDPNDEGIHGFIEGQTRGSEVSFHFVPFSKWSYVTLRVKVHSAMSFEEMKDVIRSGMKELEKDQEGQQLIYKVILEGTKSLDLVWDEDEINALGNILSLTDETDYDLDIEKLYRENQGNLLGKYIEKVMQMDLDPQKRQKVLFYGLDALYNRDL